MYFDLPTRYTPSPKHSIAIPVHAGIIQAPNNNDNGTTINNSSNGENNDIPSIMNIDPIIKCFILIS